MEESEEGAIVLWVVCDANLNLNQLRTLHLVSGRHCIPPLSGYRIPAVVLSCLSYLRSDPPIRHNLEHRPCFSLSLTSCRVCLLDTTHLSRIDLWSLL